MGNNTSYLSLLIKLLYFWLFIQFFTIFQIILFSTQILFIMVLDPATIFALEVAENNSKLKEQSGIDTLEISDDYFYSIESEVGINYLKLKE